MSTGVLAAFEELLQRQRLTERQQNVAQTRVEGLGRFFNTNFTMAITPFAVGSYARQTICAAERDIDLIAPFAANPYWERYKSNSRTFLYWVRDTLNDRYATTRVSSRQVAVKLDFTDIVTDVVPCFRREGGGYLMPNGSAGWMATNPPFHTDLMKDANLAHGSRLKPLVRLLKAWNIANGHHLSSFHMELTVERAERGCSLRSWPAEVADLLRVLPGWVRRPFPDPWPDGQRIDNYLSADERDRAARMLESDALAAAQAEKHRIEGRIKEAFERWDVVYRGTFPAYG